MSDFEQRRKEQEAARRAAAAERDATRRDALSQGARAPSPVGATGADTLLRGTEWIGLGVAALGALIAVPAALGSSAITGVLGLAVVGLGLGLRWVGRRSRAARRQIAADRDARLAALSGELSGGPEWEKALARARTAVRSSDLPKEQADATLAALEEAATELTDLQRRRLATGGKELASAAADRTAAFISNCEEIATALAREPGPTAGQALDRIAEQLGAEAEARRELDEALRRASTLRQPGG